MRPGQRYSDHMRTWLSVKGEIKHFSNGVRKATTWSRDFGYRFVVRFVLIDRWNTRSARRFLHGIPAWFFPVSRFLALVSFFPLP